VKSLTNPPHHAAYLVVVHTHDPATPSSFALRVYDAGHNRRD
jgi:hypothetical protein